VAVLYPAVDIVGGRAVRLEQGDFERQTDYGDPLDAARLWVDQGARRLHVVDLDGAREGRPVNHGQLTRIASELGSSLELLQYGGGLRDADSARAALAAGADRVVLGTAAFRDDSLLDEVLRDDPERVAVGVDVRDGQVVVHGWQEHSQMDPVDAIGGLVQRGVRTIVHTDVNRDGTLGGIDVEGVRTFSAAVGEARFICSGGIGTLADLTTRAGLQLTNLEGVIVGKALFERRFTVEGAVAALAG
jgi:phosphoribosylformimino-5-aminoimidazole carboxamide ribotide isomerase